MTIQNYKIQRQKIFNSFFVALAESNDEEFDDIKTSFLTMFCFGFEHVEYRKIELIFNAIMKRLYNLAILDPVQILLKIRKLKLSNLFRKSFGEYHEIFLKRIDQMV